MAEFIQCAIDNGVGIITLDRPEANNALHADAAKELWEATTELTEDPSVRAILVRANGKMFCSGGDLKYMLALEDEAALAKALKVTTTYFHAAVSRLLRGNAPVVMAIQGAAAGGGFSFAITGDIVIAAESAKFKMAYTASGISPDGGSTWFLPRLVGLRVAQRLALENPTLTAQEALGINLVTQVVPDDELAGPPWKRPAGSPTGRPWRTAGSSSCSPRPGPTGRSTRWNWKPWRSPPAPARRI